MKLIERDDFEQWVIAAAERSGLPEAFVEKDYFVTEALRAVVAAHSGAVVFKGGTSLSKGWRILDRFSEDLDILIRPGVFTPPWTSDAQMTRGLKGVCSVVGDVAGLSLVPNRTTVSRPKRRAQFFAFEPHFAEFTGIESGLLVEPGIGSGDWPTASRQLSSHVADAVVGAGARDLVATDDLDPFEVEVLALGRTFVEKLYIVHAAVVRHCRGEAAIDRRARHFADLAVLVEQPDVRSLLADRSEYRRIVADVDRATLEWYGPVHMAPASLSLAESSVFIPHDAFASIDEAYQRECGRLFFGRAFPSLRQSQERLEGVRHLL